MNNFVTVFLFTQDTSPLVDARAGLLIGTISLFVGIGLILIALTKPKWFIAGGWKTFLPPGIFVTLWAILWLGVSIPSYRSYSQRYETLLNIYNAEEFKVAEGIVHVMSVQPKAGHAPGDMIQIDDVQFEVNNYSGSFGYNTSIAHKGVLTEGRYVRVYYHEKTILRIDLKQETDQ